MSIESTNAGQEIVPSSDDDSNGNRFLSLAVIDPSLIGVPKVHSSGFEIMQS